MAQVSPQLPSCLKVKPSLSQNPTLVLNASNVHPFLLPLLQRLHQTITKCFNPTSDKILHPHKLLQNLATNSSIQSQFLHPSELVTLLSFTKMMVQSKLQTESVTSNKEQQSIFPSLTIHESCILFVSSLTLTHLHSTLNSLLQFPQMYHL